MITLQPVTLQGAFYAPSRILKPRQMSRAEFMKKYSDHPHPIPMANGPVTGYNSGMGKWHIVVGEE